MIYSVDFIKMAGKINHINMVKFLHDLGWEEFITKNKNAKTYQRITNDSFHQVDIPTSRNLRDYSIAMYRAIETISSVVNQSVEQVLLDLLNPISDIIRVQIKDKEMESGSIFIEDAIKLYDNAKKLLTATALDYKNPRPVHLGRTDATIQEFVSNCRFGQTEIGSYVVSVICPMIDISQEKIVQLSLFSDEETNAHSLTRNVIKKLITSMQRVKEAIDDGSPDDIIVESSNYKPDISANFLEALNSIGIFRNGVEVNFDIKWAPTIKDNRSKIEKITLNHDYYEPINALVKKLKENVEEEKIYIGKISRLNSNPDAEKRTNGNITLVYIGDNKTQTSASVNLPLEYYELAIEAHKDGAYVKVRGKLTGQTRIKNIECTDFELIHNL